MTQVRYFGPRLDVDSDEPTPSALGSKGFGLEMMVRLGLPVPPGFTVTTALTTAVRARGGRLDASERSAVTAALARLAANHRQRFIDPHGPGGRATYSASSTLVDAAAALPLIDSRRPRSEPL